MTWHYRLAAWSIALLALAAPAAAAPRYQAVWVDGSTDVADTVADWGRADGKPRWKNRDLLAGEPALRSLRDLQLEPNNPPAAFVEFFGGDVLPGKVVGYRAEVELPVRPVEAHLIVEPAQALHLPPAEPRPLRVLPALVKRIAWQRRSSERYQPATLFYRDGRQQAFRSLRWSDNGVRLLLEQGTTLAPWEQIAELHLPLQGAWDAQWQILAGLSTSEPARRMRMETVDHLQVTTSIDRFTVNAPRDVSRDENWLHVVQPVWSLDTLAVPYRRIRLRVLFEPNEIPLSSLEPSEHHSRHALAAAWREPRVDSNVQGSAMRCARRLAAWGLGVQAYDELYFELPPMAAQFRTLCGLDDVCQTGGCARGKIALAPAAGKSAAEPALLWESTVQIGSGAPQASPALRLPAADGRRLLLLADSVDQPPAPQADPLDLRDAWNWFEPVVELDRDALSSRLTRPIWEQLPGLVDWRGYAEAFSMGMQLVPYAGRERGFMRVLTPRAERVVLSQRIKVEPETPVLCLSLAHSNWPAEKATRLAVSVEGREVAKVAIGVWRDEPVAPLLVPLDEWLGRDVQVELALESPKHAAALVWLGAALVAKPSAR